MRKRKSLVAALALSLLIQGVAGNVAVDKAYAEQVRSQSVTQMSSEKEVVNLTSFSKKSKRTENFNEDWKFYLGDASNAESLSFDDSQWKGVNLPHDYSIHQEFSTSMEAESGYLPGGIGWYRKHFSLTQDMKDKEFRLDFDGVYMDATVWVNGKLLGSHPYGYTPFSFNLTKHLKFDGTDNVVTVKVNHQTPSSRWYSGSGIYRDVKLQIMNKVHVDLNGVKIETPELATNKDDVKVNIKVKLVNALTENKNVKIKAKIFKKGNEAEVIGNAELENKVLNTKAVSDVLLNLTAKSPKLWDTENPNLYTVRVEVLEGDEVLDTYDSDYGFRWFTANKDTGTYLNGKPVKLKGVCMHHDQGALGAAAYKRATERQVEILKDMGCNSIRVTHNPASQVLIDICNEKGILLIEEMFDGWMHPKNGNRNDYAKWFNRKIDSNNSIVGAKANMTWAEFDLRAAIARGQNSPAIVMWSLGNEIQEGTPDYSSGFAAKAPDLIKWAKDVDDTRILTIGSNAVKGGGNEHTRIGDQLTDVGGMSGTNYSDGANYDYIRGQHPEWIIYGSETASSVNSRGVYTTLRSNTLDKNKQLTSYDESKVNWGALASAAWYDVITRDFVAGEYVWTGFDYIGEPTPVNGTGIGVAPGTTWPAPKNSYFGIIDTAGFPKDSYYFYQSQWNDKKRTLHILPAWNEDAVKKSYDGKVKVVVYSDAAEVELKLNGESQGRKKFVKNTTTAGYTYQKVKGESGHRSLYMTWEVPFEKGTLEAIAYDEKGQVIENTEGRSVVKTTGKAAKLVIKADREKITADGKDLAYITVDVTDENGNIVPNAKDEITFSLEGEGEIVGVDNGSSPDHTPYNSLTRKAHAGKVLAIVKANKKAGKVTVKAEASGITEAKVDIATEAVQGGEATNVIESFLMSKNYYVKKGNLPVLPDKLTARYTDGKHVEKTVVWDNYNEELIEQSETFAITGTVEDKKVSVYVTMIDEIGGLLNYSTATSKNMPVKLPESRPAVLMDGTVLNVSFPVTWEPVAEDKYANKGIITVEGKANVLGEEIKVTSSIRVSEEEVTLGGSVTGAAHLSQDIPANMQSDRLEAIKDGKTEIGQGGDNGNDTVWSNWKYSQAGHTKAEITFRYDTQQRIGGAIVHFGRDNGSMRYPDKGVTKLKISENGNDWTDVEAEEIIGEEKGRLRAYTYKFSPLTATFVKLCITNTTAATGTNQKACTGITEVELLGVTSGFNVGSKAQLKSLTVNGEKLSMGTLEKGIYETPAQIADLTEIETVDNAAYTILTVYNSEVKIILESEDHSKIDTFVIKLDKEVNEEEEETVKEYPRENLKASAGSELIPAVGNEGPASFAIDGNLNTHWHTDWQNKKVADTPEKRTISLEMDEVQEVAELHYYPRHIGGINGFITEYKVEVIPDGQSEWVEAAKGNWTRGKVEWHAAKFAEPVKTKNVRLVGLHTYADTGNDKHASVAELKLMITVAKRDKIDESNSKLEILDLDADGKFAMDIVNEKHPAMPKVKVTRAGEVLKTGIDYRVKYFNNTAEGRAKVEITGIIKYSGKLEKEFEIVQNPKRVKAIFVSKNPKKTIYKIGEKFEAEGLELLVINSDETTEKVGFTSDNKNDFSFEPSQDKSLELSDKKIKVTYKEKATEVEIIVEEDKPQNNGGNYSAPVVPAVEEAKQVENKPAEEKTDTKTKPEDTTEVTEDLTPEGDVKETAFTKLVAKLDKSSKAKAVSIQKKVNRAKGLTLEQFAKELVKKKVIAKVDKKDIKKLLKGVKTSKWAKSYVAALVKAGVLKKSDLKKLNKKISEDFAAKMLEKLMVKAKKTKK